jgi:hypothetical protein
MHKLQHYGIIGKSVRWIQNWLANRKQSVVIDGSTSDAVSCFLFVGYTEYCAFIRVAFHAPFIFPLSQLI